jgi:hypothetical protein
VLLLADGVAYQKIQDLLDTTAPTIARWKRRFPATSDRRSHEGVASPAAEPLQKFEMRPDWGATPLCSLIPVN